jgi:hypothetical protein
MLRYNRECTVGRGEETQRADRKLRAGASEMRGIAYKSIAKNSIAWYRESVP